MADLKIVTAAEVAKHTASSDCWFIINGKAYDVTNFLADHPGGEEALLNVAGKDATDDFEDVGHSDSAREQMEEFLIGRVEGLEVKPIIKEEPVMKPLSKSQAPVTSGSGSSGLIRFILPVLLLALAFALRFFGKKEAPAVEQQ